MIEDIPFDHPDYPRITAAIDADRCPDCDGYGYRNGPRGGIGMNIFCKACGSGFNVAPRAPYGKRHKIAFVQRIKRGGST